MATEKKATKKVKSIEVDLDRERDTKNKQRFKVEDNQYLDVIYVKNAADKALGSPKKIKITIEAL